MNETTYQCPLCKGTMSSLVGDVIHPHDPKFGVSVYCPNQSCPAQEVAGHGKNLKDAYEVVLEKFKKR